MRCGLRPLCRCSLTCAGWRSSYLPSAAAYFVFRVYYTKWSENSKGNYGQKIARGISSVGKFRDAKRIDKAGSVPYNKGGRNDARFIHNKSPLFSLRRSCKKESIRTTDALFFARYIKISRMGFRHSSNLRTAMKASVGSWTVPRVRIFFLPSFCFSSSFFFRLMSPP